MAACRGAFSRQAAILKVVEEKALGTRLSLSHTTSWHVSVCMSEETGETGENSGVRLRLTESQPTYSIYSRAGRRAWWALRQPDSLRSTAREFSPYGFLSIYEPRATGLNFGEQMRNSVSLLMRAVLAWLMPCKVLYSLVWLAVGNGFDSEACTGDHLASDTTFRHFIKYQELYLSLMPNCSVW